MLALAQINANGARKEPGCIAFDVYRDPDALVVILHEVFDDEAALAFHKTTDHFQRFVAGLPALVSGERTRQALVSVDSRMG
ncbi:MAG: autoinducer 2-degrading protein LsrG [Mameliella sp.]|nr:autoinducer 2-degrading protein LsrG [Mameliella sp.]